MRTKDFINTILVGCMFVACSQDDSSVSIDNSMATSHRISVEQAKLNAIDFASKVNSKTRSGRVFEVDNVQAISLPASSTRSTSDSINLDTLLYIVNFADSAGFVIAGTDDRENSIYAYIEEGNYSWGDSDTHNSGFAAFLYALLESKSYDGKGNFEEHQNEYEGHGGGGGKPSKFEVMSPLLVTKWSQENPYNTYCPNGITGCVATAVSQICSFLEEPRIIQWNYNNEIGSVNLDWSKIKSECKSTGKPSTTANQIARLMRHWGDRFNANYGANSTEIDSDDAIDTMQGLEFNVTDLDDYDVNNVVKSLKKGNKIVYMRGNGRYYHVGLVFRKYVDGHAWVVDGYIDEVKQNKQSYYLHCNWGWGGYRNGYFLNNAFNAEQNPPYNDNAKTRSSNFRYNLETAIFTK